MTRIHTLYQLLAAIEDGHTVTPTQSMMLWAWDIIQQEGAVMDGTRWEAIRAAHPWRNMVTGRTQYLPCWQTVLEWIDHRQIGTRGDYYTDDEGCEHWFARGVYTFFCVR